mgnify:CR=1 FL=1
MLSTTLGGLGLFLLGLILLSDGLKAVAGVMTIGFVNAGLMTFGQAVGVIFGANIGSTSTGWIVSVIGLKVSLGAAAMPVVGVGALMRLVLRGRGAALGLALAGFGLMFSGSTRSRRA